MNLSLISVSSCSNQWSVFFSCKHVLSKLSFIDILQVTNVVSNYQTSYTGSQHSEAMLYKRSIPRFWYVAPVKLGNQEAITYILTHQFTPNFVNSTFSSHHRISIMSCNRHTILTCIHGRAESPCFLGMNHFCNPVHTQLPFLRRTINLSATFNLDGLEPNHSLFIFNFLTNIFF